MIDPGKTLNVAIVTPSSDALFLFEVWGDGEAAGSRFTAAFGLPLPSPCKAMASGDIRALWWEPQTWLVRVPVQARDMTSGRLQEVIAQDGAVTDISGAFRRLSLVGEGWRAMLMIGGVFDAEGPTFAPGSVAGTVIHHLPVRLDVIDERTVEAYTPPSYAADLLHHWTRAVASLQAVG